MNLKCIVDAVLDETDPYYAPVYVSVSVTPLLHWLGLRNIEHIAYRLKPTSVLIEKNYGSFNHTVEVDGQAKVCVRASGAYPDNIMRFGVHIAVPPVDMEKLAKLPDDVSGGDQSLSDSKETDPLAWLPINSMDI